MMEILKYSLSGFWIFIGTYLLASLFLYFIVNGITKIWSRLMRCIMVSIHGWPKNPNLDADGDFKNDSVSL